ncbi:MAG: restriction endonuclease [Burkholderiales bacterium PBB4]|nr:MAG: restriction endonuclease [Burkholderiales bacterium PBB4]
MPWWVGVVLAAASYLYFHGVASRPAPVVVAPGQVGHALLPTLWYAASSALQYAAPLLCLAGAGLSAYRRRSRARLLANATANDSARVVDQMAWREFEQLVGEAFRRQGFAVAELGGTGPDGGVDLELSKGGERFLVQCKQWRAQKVGVAVVRELYGVMAAKGATGGFVVTSGRFTNEATAFASGRNVKLIDGTRLSAFLRAPTTPAGQARAPADNIGLAAADAAVAIRRASAEQVPSCPKCSKPMVRRVARQGTAAGNAFWGCTGYPGCRGTRQIEG